MWECNHRRKRFVAVTAIKGQREVLFSCHRCGMMIAQGLEGSHGQLAKLPI